MAIKTLIQTKPFFQRFNNLKQDNDKKMFLWLLKRAQVELYRKDQVIFLNNRVGVMTMGSCEIRSHSVNDLLKPTIVKKAIAGDILGALQDQSKDLMRSPMTWLVSLQDQTEVIFFNYDDFKKLWFLQRRFTEQFLVIEKLRQNKLFNQLNRCTQYHLVYECLDLRKFYPGQLMLSVHKRSPLSPIFHAFFKEGTNKLRKQIENRILSAMESRKKTSVYQGFVNELGKKSRRQVTQALGQSLLRGTKITNAFKMTAKQRKVNDDTSDLETDSESSNNNTPSIKKRKSRLQKLASKVEETQSNSTDYGVEHCQ